MTQYQVQLQALHKQSCTRDTSSSLASHRLDRPQATGFRPPSGQHVAHRQAQPYTGSTRQQHKRCRLAATPPAGLAAAVPPAGWGAAGLSPAGLASAGLAACRLDSRGSGRRRGWRVALWLLLRPVAWPRSWELLGGLSSALGSLEVRCRRLSSSLANLCRARCRALALGRSEGSAARHILAKPCAGHSVSASIWSQGEPSLAPRVVSCCLSCQAHLGQALCRSPCQYRRLVPG